LHSAVRASTLQQATVADYRSAINYLYGLQRFGIKPGLDNITALLNYLGNPHLKLRCVHVAGTNGKGSTCAFLASITQKNGYAPGMYTSPHLEDFTERIRISGKPVEKRSVVSFVQTVQKGMRENRLPRLTFFECATALAFAYFAQHKADPVIIETGMGGRFDATNVVRPLISVITTVSLEHQQYLGRTLSAIAGEKAGIIKPCCPVVCGALRAKALEVIKSKAAEKKAPLYMLGRDFSLSKTGRGIFFYSGLEIRHKKVFCGLRGDYQMHNASLAIAAAELLRHMGYALTTGGIAEGIKKAFWPGRLEIIGRRPVVLLDGAHNPEGWMALVRFIDDSLRPRRIIFLLGIMEDKNIERMLKILTPKAYAIIFCRPALQRAADKILIKKHISFSSRRRILWIQNPEDAFTHALAAAGPDDLVCVTGSLFLIGAVRSPARRNGPFRSGPIGL